MPAPETSDRWQKALLWAKLRNDGHGDPVRDEAIELSVRWVNSRRDVNDGTGNRISLEAEALVDRKVRIGSLMWLGTLDEWPGTGIGINDEELMVVVSYEEATDVKGRIACRIVGLAKYRDALPARG